VIEIDFAGGPDDIDFATYFPGGIRINGIGFVASASTDVFVLKHKTDAGVAIVTMTGSSTISWAQPITAHLYFDKSACTFTTPHSCKAIIQLA